MLFRSIRIMCIAVAVYISTVLIGTANADEASDRDGQTILHMLDYVSVDYGGAVLYGKVLNEREFGEQSEFAAQAAVLMDKLPPHPKQAALVAKATEIANDVKNKAPSDHVSNLALQLRSEVIDAYHIRVSPRRIPDTLPALALFQQLCAPCHGATGHGDGPLSKLITPKPADFYNEDRMEQRSIYGLYSSISLGVRRTPMTAFTQLSDEDRWSLAFLVSNFRTAPEEIEKGRKIWQTRNYQGPTPDLAALTTLTDNEIRVRYGAQTNAIFTYLRSEPQALKTTPHATLIFAAEQLDSALNRYRENNQSDAQRLSISAYLEGFEPMEIGLDNLDKNLRHSIEYEMMNVRQLISSNAPTEEVAKKISLAKSLLKQADERLRDGQLSVAGTFSSSLYILLRECFEGVLVLSALMAFAIRNGQHKALSYVHRGWMSAVVLGILTWVVARWITEISGIDREVFSSITALATSAMLIYLGFWLYNKTYGQVWHDSLPEQLRQLLTGKNLWMLTLLSYITLYRAMFESAVFYDALWIQTAYSTRPVMWSGILTATIVLLAVGWAVFQFGMSLSSKALFFSTSVLLATLAVIFAGQGVTSLQKAGIVAANKIDFVSLPMLGITPTTQTLLVQLIVLGILITGHQVFTRKHRD